MVASYNGIPMVIFYYYTRWTKINIQEILEWFTGIHGNIFMLDNNYIAGKI